MRVIAGTARGTRLFRPKGRAIRPTSDLAREALFSRLGQAVPGAAFLDLCCGTGAIAVEALSRGAAGAVLVDSDRAAVALAARNLEKAGLGAAASVLRRDAAAYLRSAAGRGESFDIIYVDPPYEMPPAEAGELLRLAAGVLVPGGVLVLERRRGAEVQAPPGLALEAEKRYGEALLTYFRPASGADADLP